MYLESITDQPQHHPSFPTGPALRQDDAAAFGTRAQDRSRDTCHSRMVQTQMTLPPARASPITGSHGSGTVHGPPAIASESLPL